MKTTTVDQETLSSDETGAEDTNSEEENDEEEIESTEAGSVSFNKDQAEEIIEAGKTIISAGRELVEAKRRNDSIKLSRREKIFAYQLGLPLKNEKLVMEAYKRLTDQEKVCVLKKSRKEYLLIKYEEKTEGQLDEELESYKALYGNEITGPVKKIELVRECGKNKAPMFSGKIKVRKEDIQIDCLTCYR